MVVCCIRAHCHTPVSYTHLDVYKRQQVYNKGAKYVTTVVQSEPGMYQVVISKNFTSVWQCALMHHTSMHVERRQVCATQDG